LGDFLAGRAHFIFREVRPVTTEAPLGNSFLNHEELVPNGRPRHLSRCYGMSCFEFSSMRLLFWPRPRYSTVGRNIVAAAKVAGSIVPGKMRLGLLKRMALKKAKRQSAEIEGRWQARRRMACRR